MKKYLLGLLLIVAWLNHAHAQRISVSAPSQLATGENFRIAYTINTQDVDDFKEGSIPEAFTLLAGPYTSSQASFQMVNGHTSSSSSITYTYTLYASKAGTYTISPAHAIVNGKKVASPVIKITVSGSVKPTPQGSPRMNNSNDEDEFMRAAGSRISGNDLFIKVSANKKKVHEQEPILLTYKVYSLVELSQLNGKMPDLTGFHTQEVKLPAQKSFHLEHVNGRNYKTVTWSQYVMYPQMHGSLKIPSITFKGIVVQRDRSVDPLEAIFNGGSGYVEVQREIVAPGLTIDVEPLPNRPSNFSGGVGNFNISAQLNKNEVKAGDPLNLRLVISGVGNLKLLKTPTVNFPKDFEKYDAKVTDKTKLTTNGIEGNIIYDYLAVPQNPGTFQIPATEFTYYDIRSKAYKTIKTQAFTVKVTPGNKHQGGISNFEENKQNDIRSIKEAAIKACKHNPFFFNSLQYWLTMMAILLVGGILFFMLHKYFRLTADMSKLKGSKADKVALKHLKQAERLMKQNKQNDFYDEVLRALWGYVSDKLTIPAEKLNRDNIVEQLTQHNVGEETISNFITALDECEYARYAPGDPKGNMNKTYDMAFKAITSIETIMKSKKKYSFSLLVILLLFLTPSISHAVTKANADSEYKKGNYQQAITDYKELLKSDKCAEVYYNLGNAYFRSDSITQAILAYERARLLSPGDQDIHFNLQLARSKTIDKITDNNDIFPVVWYHALINSFSTDGWAYIAILSLTLFTVLFMVYLFSRNVRIRKISFTGLIVFILLCIFSHFAAYKQKSEMDDRNGAIIIVPSASIKQSPVPSNPDAFILHEGTRVNIIDRSIKGWLEIELIDGRSGWLQSSTVELI